MGLKRGASSSPPSLKALAIGYLCRREYSRLELRGRLMAAGTQDDDPSSGDPSSGDPSAKVDALLDWLEAHGYLCDARFVESRVHARSARHGTLRIKQELARHGLELGAEQVAALRATEFGRAKAVWDRKFGERASDARARAAQARFLAGRGFSAEVVRRIVGGDDEP